MYCILGPNSVFGNILLKVLAMVRLATNLQNQETYNLSYCSSVNKFMDKLLSKDKQI